MSADLPQGDLSKLNAHIKNQFAAEFVGMMTEAMESKCFSRCIKKPGIKMERNEETCLIRCMDRFMESWGAVSETVSRIQEKLAHEPETNIQQ